MGISEYNVYGFIRSAGGIEDKTIYDRRIAYIIVNLSIRGHGMNKLSLTEFQTHLRSKSLIREKYISYYAYWARNFLTFLDSCEPTSQDLCIEKYINSLHEQPNIADWQIRQAYDAAQLFIYSFLGGDLASLHPNVQESSSIRMDISSIVSDTRNAIRIKLYSYRTEQTYIDWIKRFSEYVRNIKKKTDIKEGYDVDDVKDYLSYLALNKRVSASTQNQAFNALLFLFRNILRKEIGDISKTVRAKRGQRLPVVLSVDEIKDIFKYVKGVNGLILQLLYGAGLRLMEALQLRVKDIDFTTDVLFIRNGKGDSDRTTVLPDSIKNDLKLHLKKVQLLHKDDLDGGYGEVYLPHALARKYPNAAKAWYWQYVFPSYKLSADPRTAVIRRHHIHQKTIQSSLKAAVRKTGIAKHVSVHTLRQLCHSPINEWSKYKRNTATFRS